MTTTATNFSRGSKVGTVVFELLEPSIGEKEERFMKNNTNNDKPIGKLKVVADFLPPPDQLLSKGDMVKITLAVDKSTLRFFKVAAKTSKSKYQKMMREVLKRYASQYRSA